MASRKKQSFIAGALTSSAGIFISKALGLFYVVPFVAMATQENMGYYSAAYSLYDIILTISSAGIPFAIAAMVAKYSMKNDYKTVLLVRKLSMSLLLSTGFLMAVAVLMFAMPYAKFVSTQDASIEYITTLKNVISCLSLAIFLVPFLSAYRGYYQGLKDFKSYSLSQVLEQFTRVALLLILGALFVYGLQLDSIWAVYMGVISTGIAAVIAILYYFYHDTKNFKQIKLLAKQQTTPAVDKKAILKELIWFGTPCMLAAILGNSMNFVNMLFFQRQMTSISSNVSPEEASYIFGIMMTNVNKLTSIPQVLAIGFSTGIVPFLTVYLEKKDYVKLRKNILSALSTVTYIAAPLCFCLFALSDPIYYIMYGAKDLVLGSEILAYSSLYAFVSTISPITTNIMLSLRFRKKSLFYLLLGFISKFILFFIMMDLFGYTGAITSSVITCIFVICLNLSYVKKRYKVSYKPLLKVFISVCAGLISMNGVFVLLRLVNFTVIDYPQIIGVFQLAVYGIVGILVYFMTTAIFNTPQKIFNMSLVKMINKVKGK